MSAPTVNLFDPGFLADPYPTYRWLRDHSPVHHLGGEYWVVSRHAELISVLRDPATFSSELGYGTVMTGSPLPGSDPARNKALAKSGMGLLTRTFAGLRVLISTDPPDHTRLRRLVSRSFTPRSVAALEPRVRQICTDLVRTMLDSRVDGVSDLWEHVSYPLPTMVIAELLGIPPERRADFKRWSDAIVSSLSLAGAGDVSLGAADAMEMFQYFGEVIAERRREPRSDLISQIVHDSAADDDPLTPPELVAFCVLLLIAGNETTTNLLGNFFEAMRHYPDQYRLLRREPTRIAAAVEETLRYDSPIQGLWRGLRSSAQIGGVEVPEGSLVMTLFASANRDSSVFGSDAETFRVDREPTSHVAFGNGIHFCLGASLARMEARVAIGTILRHTSDLNAAGEPVRPLTPALRGVRSQPLQISAS